MSVDLPPPPSPAVLWREWFGKPDGILVRLRCRLVGHRWEVCRDGCCMGQREWCARCLGSRDRWRAAA